VSDTTIERGLPIPPSRRESIEVRYPEMLVLEVGDSFLAKHAPLGLHIGIAMWGIKHNQRHEVRQVQGDDYRIWRLA